MMGPVQMYFSCACTNKTLMKLFRKNVGHQAIGSINKFAGARDNNSDVALQDIRSGEMLHRRSGSLDCANNRRQCLLAGDVDTCSTDICTMLADEIVDTAYMFYRSCVAVSKTSQIIVDMGGTGTYYPVESHHFYQGAFFEIAPRLKGGKVLFVSQQMVTMLELDIVTLQGTSPPGIHAWHRCSMIPSNTHRRNTVSGLFSRRTV